MTAFAFVFPGQGSQAVGMLNAWEGHAAVRDTLAEASEALGEGIGKLGVVGTIKGTRPGPRVVGLRAAKDALQITEHTGVP